MGKFTTPAKLCVATIDKQTPRQIFGSITLSLGIEWIIMAS